MWPWVELKGWHSRHRVKRNKGGPQENTWTPQVENGVQGGAWVSATPGGIWEPCRYQNGSRIGSEVCNDHFDQRASMVISRLLHIGCFQIPIMVCSEVHGSLHTKTLVFSQSLE